MIATAFTAADVLSNPRYCRRRRSRSGSSPSDEDPQLVSRLSISSQRPGADVFFDARFFLEAFSSLPSFSSSMKPSHFPLVVGSEIGS